MGRGESSSRESEEAGTGGELKAGDRSGVGEKLSVVDRGDGCGEDSSEKRGGMVDEMSGKWIAWMVGLGSKSDTDAKSARGSDGRGRGPRGDATRTCEDEVGGERDGRGRCAIESMDAGRAGGERECEGVAEYVEREGWRRLVDGRQSDGETSFAGHGRNCWTGGDGGIDGGDEAYSAGETDDVGGVDAWKNLNGGRNTSCMILLGSGRGKSSAKSGKR